MKSNILMKNNKSSLKTSIRMRDFLILVEKFANMPMHSIFIVNTTGNVVFSKYFGFSTRKLSSTTKQEEKSLLFEQFLYENTKSSWSTPAIAQRKLSFSFDNIYIIFQKVGEVIVYAIGSDDFDEPICKESFICLDFKTV